MRNAMFYLHRSLGVIGILLLLARSADAQEYKIKLVHPWKVGQQYSHHITATVKEIADTTMNGQAQPQMSDGNTIELNGVITVLAVNTKTGGVTKLSCKAEKLTRDGQNLYPPGAIILAEKIGTKTRFIINGKPADDANQEALDSVLQVSDPKGTVTNDEMTGTTKPQKVGDSWPVNADKLARQIGMSGLPITGDTTKGQSTLVKVEGLHDDTMTIQTVVTAEGFKKKMPDRSVMSDGHLKLEATAVLAVDPAVPGGTSTTKMHVTMTMTQPDGAQVSKVTVDRDATEENHLVEP